MMSWYVQRIVVRFGVIRMAKVEDCTHMELYDIGYADVELVGSKIILCLYLRDILTEVVVKRLGISATNIPKLLKQTNKQSVLKLRKSGVRCLVNNFREINYVSLTKDKDDWIFCQDLHIMED